MSLQYNDHHYSSKSNRQQADEFSIPLSDNNAQCPAEMPNFRFMPMRQQRNDSTDISAMERASKNHSGLDSIPAWDKTTAQCKKYSNRTSDTAYWEKPHAPKPNYYHYLEFHHAKLPLSIDLLEIATCLKQCFGRLSLQTVYQDNPMVAHCSTIHHPRDHCCLTVTVLRDDNDADENDSCVYGSSNKSCQGGCWVIEVQRRSTGDDSFTFNARAREIINALQRLDNKMRELQLSSSHSSSIGTNDSTCFFPTQKQQTTLVHKLNRFIDVSHGKNEVAPGSGTGMMWSKPDTVTTSHNDELSIVAEKLQSRSFEDRQIGLETLTILTDCFKTVKSAAVRASRAILLGRTSETPLVESRENNDPFFHRAIHDHVLQLALRGVTDGADQFSSEQAHTALVAVSNALIVANASDVEEFVRLCSMEYNLDIMSYLLNGTSSEDLGRAYYCLTALKAICEKVPIMRERIRDHHRHVIEYACSMGQCLPHAAVEQASQGLVEILKGH